jgi:hypothetical protein
MGFWKKLGTAMSGTPSEEELEEQRKYEKQLQMKREERKRRKNILQKFTFKELKLICNEILGREPDDIMRDEDGNIERFEDGTPRKYHDDRFLYEDFICDPQNFKLEQIKDFAIKHSIVPFNHFSNVTETDSKKREFEDIVDKIKLYFKPEKITNEEHLEAQLTVFLRASFHDKKITRQEGIKSNDQLDIVVDDTFVFELKVPKNRTDLRNLVAQIDEYKEEYPYICIVIADTSDQQGSDEKTVNVTDDINSYKIKYKEKFDVDTLVFKIGVRKR